MSVARLFRRFLLRDQYIQSRAEFKRTILTGYLALICIVVNILYMVLDSHQGYFFLSWLNAGCCFACSITLLLIRAQKHILAKLIMFLAVYAVIFVFCALEPPATGVSFFFILLAMGAIALFGVEQWPFAAGLSLLGAILFLITVVGGFRLDSLAFSDDYIRFNFILNFFVILTTAILILYFMIDLNHYAERTLEEKEAETNTKNKELTKLNAELDRFVYSVSHDLRSPLASISGLVNIGHHAENLDEAKRYFNMIGDRINAQDFFIREIIDFYRNSRTETAVEKFPLRKHVDEIVGEQAMNLGSIHCHVEIPADMEVQSDKIRLKSVLSNLIGNAIKYHDIAKAEKYIKVSAERQNGHWIIAVEDNGQGIGAEHLPKLFNMFYRASADSKGSGLGLFIARETVDKLGGKIHVDSTLGKGSKFWFTVAAPAQAEPKILL
jgi:signal transduction histidine kinase